jgi:uncharacterized membrane protein YoaK (UPF0700 family)
MTENTASIIINIVTGTTSSILTLLIVFVYNKIAKPPTAEKNSASTTAKERYFRLTRYSAILAIMVLFVIFVSLNKWFVLLIGFCFSIVVIMFIYDYAISVVRSMSDRLREDERDGLKKANEAEIRQLIANIPDPARRERLEKLVLK